jgi:hypothetical protein
MAEASVFGWGGRGMGEEWAPDWRPHSRSILTRRIWPEAPAGKRSVSWSPPSQWTPAAGKTTTGEAQQIVPRIPNVGQCDRLQRNSLCYVCRIQIHLSHSSSTNPKILKNSLNSQKSTSNSIPAIQNQDSREIIGQDKAPDDTERFHLCFQIQQKTWCELVDRHAGKGERDQLQATLVRLKEFVQLCEPVHVVYGATIGWRFSKSVISKRKISKAISCRNRIPRVVGSWCVASSCGGGLYPEIIIPALTLNSNMPRSKITIIRNYY